MSLIPIIIALAFIAFVAIYAVTKIKHCCLPKRRAKINVMKRAAALLFIFATLNAAAAAKDPTALYKAGEVQVQALAFTETEDFSDFNSGGGAAATYWFTENFGAGFEAKTFDTRHAIFDRMGLNLAGRIPLKDSGIAPFAHVGFDWDAEASSHSETRSEFDLYVGAGIEKRWRNDIAIGAEARIVSDYQFRAEERYQFLAFLSKTF